MSETAPIFGELGARPVINAAGAYTVLGGSRLSPGVREAMEQANVYFADMKGLLSSSGQLVASMLGAEAGFVTAGAGAALVLATAACLTLRHPEYLERLPDAEGIPNQIVTHRVTRQKYDRLLTLAGARLVDIGDERGATLEQLHAAVTPETVAVHYVVPAAPVPGLLPVEQVIAAAHEHDLPAIVDAAGRTYPLYEMRSYPRLGADLVCYAGKYFDAPHSTGMLLGRKDLIDMVAVNSFVGFETSGYLTLGRPMKVDRQEIVGLVVALREWLAMDHEERFMRYGERCDRVLAALKGLPGLRAHRISEKDIPTPMVRDGVRIHFDAGPARAEAVVAALKDGEPCVWTRVDDNQRDAINLSVAFFRDEDLEVVVRRLSEVLAAG